IIQGVTEFLPVSSSGHLVIYNELIGEAGETNLTFSVLLHFATLLAVIVVFHKDVWMLIREFFGVLVDLVKFFGVLVGLVKDKPDFNTPERRFLLMVIIGTIPAVLAGVGIKMLDLDSVMKNIFVVAAMLVVTAIFMFLVDSFNRGKYGESDAPMKTPLLVGIFQAVAILPGLSRSGSTIFSGLLGGLRKDFAVRFAFILSIPAILGAGLLELKDAIDTYGFALDPMFRGIQPLNLLTGFAAAAVFGFLSIKFIKVLIRNQKFYIFGIYCLLAAVFAVLVGTGVI
ncbi:MAG: undecaprenyl-diphosphate phosphatase, partial [Oscillospiraceae bacterium]|nr:undecaprenyl-diphosphate phosphatase [Oscillospiraceae bacterium]